MKKLTLFVLTLLTSSVVLANGPEKHYPNRHWPQDRRHHQHYDRHSHDRYYWVAPGIIGGIIGYSLARPETSYIEQAPVVIDRVETPYGIVCTEWRYLRNWDGNLYRERTCYRN